MSRKKKKQEATPRKRRAGKRGIQGQQQSARGPLGGDLFESTLRFPDRRVIEIEMRRQLTELLGSQDPKVEAAQDLLMDAYDESDREQRIQLAQRALAVDPECADAYLLLSEEAETWQESLRLCQEAVAAGQRAIGSRFEETVGCFWGDLETRPYMRARLELAHCLWAGGRRQEAIGHYLDMLRLNPGDNQGVRYLAAAGLLEEGRLDELHRLLDQYDEESATWSFTRAVSLFRREGDSDQARRQLHEAMAANPHIPALLVDSELLPAQMPEYMRPGQEDEAINYAGSFVAGWKATPGAIAWLRKNAHGATAPEMPTTPSDQTGDLLDVLELPQDVEEVWQCDVLNMPSAARVERDGKSTWVVLVSNVTDDQVQHADFLAERPTPNEAWQVLLDAMLNPDGSEPRRPGRIEVRRKALWKSWRLKLRSLGINFECVDDLDHLDRVVGIVQQRYQALGLRTDRPEDVQQILELSLAIEDVWQVGVFALPTWLNDGGEIRQPWMILVVSGVTGWVLHQSLETEEPSSEAIVRTVFQAMMAPADGEPRRPRAVQVRTGDHRLVLLPHLETVGVDCTIASSTEQLDEAMESLGQFMGDNRPQPALIEIPDIDRRQVERFFDAAVVYYHAAPWRRVMADSVIRIEFGKDPTQPWFAVVIGQAGMSLGLAVYEDLDLLEELLSGSEREEEFAERMAGLSVNYGERFEIPLADLEAAEQFGWPVAAPEAFPYVYRVAPGYQINSATPAEVERLTACLETVPRFVASGQQEMACSVALSTGQMPVRLQWACDR